VGLQRVLHLVLGGDSRTGGGGAEPGGGGADGGRQALEDAADDLARALLLLVQRAAREHRAGQAGDRPLQRGELLLRLGDLGRGGGQGVGATRDRDVAGGEHLLAEDAGVAGCAERAGRQGELDVGVGEHALLGRDAALVSLEQLGASDQVRSDGDGVEGGPAVPAGVGHAGALARVVDVGGSAVDPDGAHQGAAEPGGQADIVHRMGEGVALSHEDPPGSAIRGSNAAPPPTPVHGEVNPSTPSAWSARVHA